MQLALQILKTFLSQHFWFLSWNCATEKLWNYGTVLQSLLFFVYQRLDVYCDLAWAPLNALFVELASWLLSWSEWRLIKVVNWFLANDSLQLFQILVLIGR